MDEVVDLVERSLAEETAREFEARVDRQAAMLRESIAAGEFDNEDFAMGLEVELYAINRKPEPPEPAADEVTDDVAEELDEDLSSSAWDGSLESLADESPDEGGAWSGDLEEPGQGSTRSDEEAEGDGEEPADDGAAGETADDGAAGGVGVDEPYMDPAEWGGRLATLPEAAFEDAAAKELGLHNAEVNTDPTVFGATGVAVQTTAVEMRIKKARETARAENRELVLDAMWTIPPEEGSVEYLSAVEERDGVVLAENMRQAPRYVALDNEALRHADGEIGFDVPGFRGTFPSILFESLTTSIQPHVQIPGTDEFPEYYNTAIRTLGPVLSLSTNSPFLPADMYDDVDPDWLLAETHHELRIQAFEQSVNTSENPKVRMPRDIATTADVVDRVVADDVFAPFLREWVTTGERTTFHDEHWEFDHKRGTYWRWLRCVIGGDPVDGAGDERSLRIEYRPLPTQPSTADVIGLQVLIGGLLRGLVDRNHPLAELPWQDAKRSFYNAARDGPASDLAWVTSSGDRTTERATIYEEIFRYARHGLQVQGVTEGRVDELLAPIERRRRAGETPSTWKIGRVREYVADGHDLRESIEEMQRDYFELSRQEKCFADWL